jgi:transcriptional regulator with XRE-family HTH domain
MSLMTDLRLARGRRPLPVDPGASAVARLGYEVRRARIGRSLTLEALGGLVDCTLQHLSEIERAKTIAARPLVCRLDAALGTGGRLLALLPDAVAEHVFERQDRAEARVRQRPADRAGDDGRRRALLEDGLIAVVVGPDPTARALDDAEGDELAFRWSRELYVVRDRRTLMPGLAADLRILGATGGPARTLAQLATFVAMNAVCAGDGALAEQWWRRAAAAACDSRDGHVAAYVAGQRAAHELYGGSPKRAVALASTALRATCDACPGRMHALATIAVASAALGHAHRARKALTAMERTHERLPGDVTRRQLALGAWPEERLHHARSHAAAFGPVAGAQAARADALVRYARADWRSRTQIKLHRAAEELDPGYATASLATLDAAQQRDRGIRVLALHALARCHAHAPTSTATTELRDLLA